VRWGRAWPCGASCRHPAAGLDLGLAGGRVDRRAVQVRVEVMVVVVLVVAKVALTALAALEQGTGPALAPLLAVAGELEVWNRILCATCARPPRPQFPTLPPLCAFPVYVHAVMCLMAWRPQLHRHPRSLLPLASPCC
jgi:hypothetical protein